MPRPPALIRDARDAVRSGIARLLAAQSPDGLWRDYRLRPGASEGWSTGWIGWCLGVAGGASGPGSVAAAAAVSTARRRAARALVPLCRPAGWGYNRGSVPDADSTAWAVRFLATAGVAPPHRGAGAGAVLAEYLDALGHAHTFRDPGQGTWSDAHADVTPVVGLALLACGGGGGGDDRRDLIARVRGAVLSRLECGGGGGGGGGKAWASFWWDADVYATTWSVALLNRTGGLTHEVRAAVRRQSLAPRSGATAMEAALSLLLATEMGAGWEDEAAAAADRLLDLADPADGGWPPSPLLRVPPRFDGDDASPPGPHADVHGLMTTALACATLALWGAVD